MQELSKWLGRVEAPPELWDRVRESQRAHSHTSERNWWHRLTPIAAGLAVAAVVILSVSLIPQPLHTNDPAEVRAWVKSQTGISIPLPNRLAPTVRLVSATHSGKDAQIAYQVNGVDAVLTVSMASAAQAGDGRHRLLSQTENTSSWVMRGVVYTVACPSAQIAQVACQLCHAAGETPTAFN